MTRPLEERIAALEAKQVQDSQALDHINTHLDEIKADYRAARATIRILAWLFGAAVAVVALVWRK